jgi:hypothetical protein
MKVAILTVVLFVSQADFNRRMAVGDQYGQDWGLAADKDCPKTPYDASPLASERMDRPSPPWGKDPVQAWYGWAPNLAVCEWDAERETKRARMQERCWPTWHGKPNKVTQTNRWCVKP